MPTEDKPTELRLTPWNYAFLQDTTKGTLLTCVGPAVINQTGQEVPMVYRHKQGFAEVKHLRDALRSAVIAPEGFYVSLLNPSENDKEPTPGELKQQLPDLREGHRVNIPGPHSMALWPGQHAEVVRGHHLRSNQYLLVRVYNEAAAIKHWDDSVMQPATDTESEGETVAKALPKPEDLTVGRLIVIQGTDVSFYMPPTGITVVPRNKGGYVRSALTLERLDYCILRDESGSKRFVVGPNVVFPKPTEEFISDKKNRKTFRAIELNEIQGIHLKNIAEYEDEEGIHEVGVETFLTGKEKPIYYPREEHSVIRYDGRTKHFAVAIPVGEGKYVLGRLDGKVRRELGPGMVLLDPRIDVFVRRVLSPQQCKDWYPGNDAVRGYNFALAEAAAGAPTTRAGAVSEGDLIRNVRKMSKSRGISGDMEAHYLGGAAAASGDGMVSTRLGEQHVQADGFERKGTFMEPRSITLNTKFHGIPRIDVWPGYAVQIVSTDARRVEIGPQTLLLEYDETLEAMELSTGKPKTTDELKRIVYLRVENNKVSDRFLVETSDHVQVEVKVSLVVNFIEDLKDKWWSVENYVKLMTDHVRSVVKGRTKQISIRDFYAQPIDLVRDFILGKQEEFEDGTARPGMLFKNGMRVDDVEVLKAEIQDASIRQLLDATQHEAVASGIRIAEAERKLADTKVLEAIKRETEMEKALTRTAEVEQQVQDIIEDMKIAAQRADMRLEEIDFQKKTTTERQAVTDIEFTANMKRKVEEMDRDNLQAQVEFDREVARIQQHTTALVERCKAIDPKLAAEIGRFVDERFLEVAAEHLGETAMARAQGLEATMKQVFDMFPEGMQMIKHMGGQNGNGASKTITAPQ